MFRSIDNRKLSNNRPKRGFTPIEEEEEDELERALKKLSISKPVESPKDKRRRMRRMNLDLQKLRVYEELAVKRRSGTMRCCVVGLNCELAEKSPEQENEEAVKEK